MISFLDSTVPTPVPYKEVSSEKGKEVKDEETKDKDVKDKEVEEVSPKTGTLNNIIFGQKPEGSQNL